MLDHMKAKERRIYRISRLLLAVLLITTGVGMTLESYLGIVPIIFGGYFLIGSVFGRPIVFDAINWIGYGEN